MPKRKHEISSDEEDEAIATPSESEDEKPLKAKSKPKKQVQTIKKPRSFRGKAKDGSEEEHEEEEPPSKRKKASKSSNAPVSTGGSGKILMDETGDQYIDLGNRKRATIRMFKGTVYVDIREFYDAYGVLKPGKKGIALQGEQWEALKANTDLIDDLIAQVKSK